MRIVYLVNQFPPHVTAGLGRYMEALHPRLTGAGHRLTVCTLNPGDLPEHRSVGSLSVFRPRSPLLGRLSGRSRPNRTRRAGFLLLAGQVLLANLRYVGHVRRLVRREGVDVVAVHDSTNAVAALAIHWLLRLPLVFHVHTVEYSLAPVEARGTVRDPGGVFRRLEALLARAAARVVVPSPELRDRLVAEGWDASRLVVVPLGSPFQDLPALARLSPAELLDRAGALRRRLGVAQDASMVVFVGRFERLKGVYALVEALPALAIREESVVLAMAGEGDRAGLLARATANGTAPRLRLSEGFVDPEDLLAWYAAADVCVFPSLVEPFGLVALEAMTMGRPVVLGRAFSRLFAGAGPDPAVRWVDPDPAEIARVVADLLADGSARTALGARGLARARDFRWEATAEATLAVYAEVSAESPVRRGGRARPWWRPGRG